MTILYYYFNFVPKISTIIRFRIKLKYQSRLMNNGYFTSEYLFIYQKLVNLPKDKIEKHIT